MCRVVPRGGALRGEWRTRVSVCLAYGKAQTATRCGQPTGNGPCHRNSGHAPQQLAVVLAAVVIKHLLRALGVERKHQLTVVTRVWDQAAAQPVLQGCMSQVDGQVDRVRLGMGAEAQRAVEAAADVEAPAGGRVKGRACRKAQLLQVVVQRLARGQRLRHLFHHAEHALHV